MDKIVSEVHRQTIDAFLEKGVWKIGVEKSPL